MTRKLLAAASPPPEHFANLAGLFAVVGIAISDLVTVLLRIAMAGAALLLAFRARQILAPADAAFGLLALASTYLMLFSPRTEANTYVMLVFPVALYAAQLWRRDNRRGAAWLLTGLCLGLGSNAYGTLIFQATKIWLQPLLGASFAAVFLAPRLARRAHGPGSSSVKP
jgi:hypothetical protein